MSEQEDMASDVSFDEIYDAVMDTPRGRWFLKELADRNKVSDTEQLLLAIERIQKSVESVGQTAAQPVATSVSQPAAQAVAATVAQVDHSGILKAELQELAKTIQATRNEIAAIKPRNTASSRIASNSEEFDTIITSTERATSDMISAAEKLQEISDRLRSRDWDKALAEELEDISTSIFMACSFHDITGQRTTKVINGMRYLEQRIKAMLDVWCGGSDSEVSLKSESSDSGAAGDSAPKSDASPDDEPEDDTIASAEAEKADTNGVGEEYENEQDAAETDPPALADDCFEYDAKADTQDDTPLKQDREGTSGGRLTDWMSS